MTVGIAIDAGPDFLPLSTLRKQLSDYGSNKRNERDEAEESRRYYHGDQWTPHEVATFRERKQPIVTYNRIKRKIDGVVGLVERLRQDPKAFPRTPQHQAGSDVASAVLNEVLDANKWKSLSPFVAKDGAIEPVAGIELSLEDGDRGDLDVSLHYLEPDTIFYDPRSSREDFSDARFMGVAKWLAVDDAVGMFPDAEVDLRAMASQGGGAYDELTDTDRQKNVAWSNPSAKQVRVVEHWYKRGDEWLYQFYSADLPLAQGVSPFVDEKGRTFCRFILFSANVDHDNDRYGLIRDLRGPQDEINHRRSKGLHALNTLRLYIEDKGLDDDTIERIRAEATRPDGVVILPPGVEVNEKSNERQVAGNLQMLAEAKAEIENFGPNQALVGGIGASASGRAIQLLQQAGIAELGPYIIMYRDWKLRVYRAIWNTVKRYWTAERFIRVTDDQGLAQFLAVNKLGFDEMGMPVIENALGSLDVDIIIDEGPDHTTLMEDALEALMQLAPGLAQSGKPIPPQLIIELVNMPQALKDKLLAYLDQSNQPNPAAEAAQQLQMQGAAAKVAETQARATKTQAEAQRIQATTVPDAAKTAADARHRDALATGEELETALRFMPPVPTPFGPTEMPFAGGRPTVPGMPPLGPLAQPPL